MHYFWPAEKFEVRRPAKKIVLSVASSLTVNFSDESDSENYYDFPEPTDERLITDSECPVSVSCAKNIIRVRQCLSLYESARKQFLGKVNKNCNEHCGLWDVQFFS